MDLISGLGLVASITQLIDATTTTLKHLNNVNSAPRDRAQLAQEATGILVLLTQLRYRLEGADSKNPWYNGIRRLGTDNGPLQQLHNTMVFLAEKLQPKSGIKRAGKALLWSLEKRECAELLSKIQRLNVLISLALQDDQL